MLFSQRLRVTQMKGRYYTIYTTNHLIHFFFFGQELNRKEHGTAVKKTILERTYREQGEGKEIDPLLEALCRAVCRSSGCC